MPNEDSSQPEPGAQQPKRLHVRPVDSSARLAFAIEEQNRIAKWGAQLYQPDSWFRNWKSDGDPTRPVAHWDELASSDDLRTRVRAGLLTTYALACSSELNASNWHERLQILQTGAFDVIAGELLSLGLLTEQLLTDRLHQMVADVTVSAGMNYLPRFHVRADLLPPREIEEIKNTVHPRVCYWRAQLLRSAGTRGESARDPSLPHGPARSRDQAGIDRRRFIRDLKAAGETQREMCKRLDANGIRTPEDSSWRALTWRDAYLKHTGKVKKWLSKAGKVTA